ncbi:MAG: type II toxin-antitoxin system prevent-host-death family antitoxin [Cryobacterium sp.]|nr:type II toxin-antitoxin system prevent-host-death family antitoxin [Cryobacterium sp.]MCO5294634.1 type II toxin-antitoxin system prevent-host-death family antitoxin [Homoserinimonas sp.]
MTLIPVRELRNNTAAVIDKARSGDDVTITVNGVPAVRLVPINNTKREFLTVEDLKAMQPNPGSKIPEFWEHELEGDTTDDLGPIQ